MEEDLCKMDSLQEENEELKLFNEWGKSATLKWNDELALNKKLKEEIEKLKEEIEELKESVSDSEEEYIEYVGSQEEQNARLTVAELSDISCKGSCGDDLCYECS